MKSGMLVLQTLLGVALIALVIPSVVRDHNRPRRGRSGSQWSVWAVSEMERVGPTDSPMASTHADVWAGRGEYQAFQIVVSAGDTPVADARVEASDLTGPQGARIPHQNLTLYREHYIEVTDSSPDPGWGNRPLGKGWYPDALIPFSISGARHGLKTQLTGVPFDVEPKRNQPVWVDIFVPRDAKPGTYSGIIHISAEQVSAERQERDVQVSLHVWGFTLPLKPTLKSSFGMHEPLASNPRAQEVLLENRVMPATVNPGDARNLEQRFGLNTTALHFWLTSNRNTCRMDPAPSTTAIADALKAYPQDLPVYIYSADEIGPCPNLFPTIRDWAANMHSVDPRIKNLVTVAPTSGLYDDGHGGAGVDIWVLLPLMFEGHQQAIRDVQAKGAEIWSYNDMVQDAYSPKWEIDFSPMDYRIQPGFLSQSLSLAGILYWRVDLWSASPYQDLRGFSEGRQYFPGEGMLVYPGKPLGIDGVIPSMRLKWLRDGVQDYEYVEMLKRLGRGDWALKLSRDAAADWHHWTKDPGVLASIRKQLGDELDRLSSQTATTAQ